MKKIVQFQVVTIELSSTFAHKMYALNEAGDLWVCDVETKTATQRQWRAFKADPSED